MGLPLNLSEVSFCFSHGLYRPGDGVRREHMFAAGVEIDTVDGGRIADTA